jgi:hypothetical protein
MGFRHSYNITNAAREINAAAYDACDMKSDGYVQWGAKQDLYRLKWILEDALKRCPHFSIENEWVRDQEKKRLIEVLKND